MTKRIEATAGSGKLLTPVPQGLTIAERLNRGVKFEFPKDANAVRVTIDGKMVVIVDKVIPASSGCQLYNRL